MNQVLIFTDTRIERLQQEINKTIGENQLVIVTTNLTSVMNQYDQMYHTVMIVVTK